MTARIDWHAETVHAAPIAMSLRERLTSLTRPYLLTHMTGTVEFSAATEPRVGQTVSLDWSARMAGRVAEVDLERRRLVLAPLGMWHSWRGPLVEFEKEQLLAEGWRVVRTSTVRGEFDDVVAAAPGAAR